MSARQTARQASQSGLAVAYRGQRARPLSQDIGDWVTAKRRQRFSWDAIAAMVGVPVDALRRAHDPAYGPVHTPSPGVCLTPSRAAVEGFLRTLPGFNGDDALMMGALWSVRSPLTLAGLIARAGIVQAGGETLARSARRFRTRAAALGVEIQTTATGGGWLLTPEGRELLSRLVQATRPDFPQTGAHP